MDDRLDAMRGATPSMHTVVLDDDPTGTQSAAGVQVLLAWNAGSIADVLATDGSVYLQTNSRAISETDAVALVQRTREELADAEALVGTIPLVVLRGDSTLRGHVFAETDVVAGDAVILFVPAFPAGGRTTLDGVHRVRIDGVDVPAGETEFARDPVFGYRSSNLVEWAREKGNRNAFSVPLAKLRESRGSAVATALAFAAPGELVVPDAVLDDDILLIHSGLLEALAAGVRVVVRCGAPLAALCAGRASQGLLPRPLAVPATDGLLVVCGSHTGAATEQLDRLEQVLGIVPVELSTDEARVDAAAAGLGLAARARRELDRAGVVIISTERHRRAEHDTLADGEVVMRALMVATRELARRVDVIVSKGGITSAEVASTGFGATRALVRGQVAAGISVWDMVSGGRPRTQVVVPGNVGGRDTLVDVVEALGIGVQEDA